MRKQVSSGLLGASIRAYRLLLLAYPREFRQIFGAEMVQVFGDMFRDALERGGLKALAGLWWQICADLAWSAVREHLEEGGPMLLKRCFDVVIAILALLVLAPVFAIVAVLIKLDTRGPVFFRDMRIGRDGRPFAMLKFRTMTDGAGPRRVTRVGRVLRATFLDETPQYLNVLAGDMSLIGPRPLRPGDARLQDATWQPAGALRPGMTGLAQVTNGLATGDEDTRDLDLQYARRRSAGLDLRLLAHTARLMLRGK